jgi:hypothetical protein
MMEKEINQLKRGRVQGKTREPKKISSVGEITSPESVLNDSISQSRPPNLSRSNYTRENKNRTYEKKSPDFEDYAPSENANVPKSTTVDDITPFPDSPGQESETSNFRNGNRSGGSRSSNRQGSSTYGNITTTDDDSALLPGQESESSNFRNGNRSGGPRSSNRQGSNAYGNNRRGDRPVTNFNKDLTKNFDEKSGRPKNICANSCCPPYTAHRDECSDENEAFAKRCIEEKSKCGVKCFWNKILSFFGWKKSPCNCQEKSASSKNDQLSRENNRNSNSRGNSNRGRPRFPRNKLK